MQKYAMPRIVCVVGTFAAAMPPPGTMRRHLPLLLWLVSLVDVASAPLTDSSTWVGAAYTPARASNSLWWHHYEQYVTDLHRELAAVQRHLGFTTLRVFLHTMVWEADPPRLLRNLHSFLAIAARYGLAVGFVFFDDCWGQSGADLGHPCPPRKGVHNGCWMASPQAAARGNVSRYEGYVAGVVAAFRSDPRVRFWEIYNEPKVIGPRPGGGGRRLDPWSVSLRAHGYAWAKAAGARQPVIACWDDNAATDLVDVHAYTPDFPKDWTAAVFSDPAKGALVTEAGSRWFQTRSDNGSPLLVLHWLWALRSGAAEPQDPQTNPPLGSASRLHASSRLLVDRRGPRRRPRYPFVPGAMLCWELMVGNSNTRWHWECSAGAPEPAIPFDAWLFPDGTPVSYTEAHAARHYITGRSDFLYFTDFLPQPPTANLSSDTYATVVAGRPLALWGGSGAEGVILEFAVWPQEQQGNFTVLWKYDGSAGDGGYIAYAVTLDIGAQKLRLAKHTRVPSKSGPPRFHDAAPAHVPGPDALAHALASAPAPGPATATATATSMNRSGPAEMQMALAVELLQEFDISTLDCGYVLRAWNMLRILEDRGWFQVWFNPMWTDVEDGSLMPPRIMYQDHAPLPVGQLLVETSAEHRLDYVSVLPSGVL